MAAVPWYSKGERSSDEHTTYVGAAEAHSSVAIHHGSENRWSLCPQRGSRAGTAVLESLEEERKFYAFCGMSKDAAARACSKHTVKGRLRRDGPQFEEVEGLIGKGVYCSTDPVHATGQGPELVVVRFFPGKGECGRGIKIMSAPDPYGLWREEGYAGCWLPKGITDLEDPRGELCIREEAITDATIHTPSKTFSVDKSPEVVATEWLLLRSHPSVLKRWSRRAELVKWPLVGASSVCVLSSAGLLSFGLYGPGLGTLAIAVVFGIAAF
mmetsp:Transcript_56412/g.132303  ORF Transcript_56412/g.132303 Transcript_56412/m.132303 type:complete len:269 (+) Transcript_56412:58-864(+)